MRRDAQHVRALALIQCVFRSWSLVYDGGITLATRRLIVAEGGRSKL